MKRDKDTRAITKGCHSEGRVLLSQKERKYLACAYISSFDEELQKSGNSRERYDEIEAEIACVMSILDSDLIVSVEWLKRILGEINERNRKR